LCTPFPRPFTFFPSPSFPLLLPLLFSPLFFHSPLFHLPNLLLLISPASFFLSQFSPSFFFPYSFFSCFFLPSLVLLFLFLFPLPPPFRPIPPLERPPLRPLPYLPPSLFFFLSQISLRLFPLFFSLPLPPFPCTYLLHTISLSSFPTSYPSAFRLFHEVLLQPQNRN